MAYTTAKPKDKMYYKNFMALYMEVFGEAYNSANIAQIDDIDARVAATNTFMIQFGKATGMDVTGVVHFDEALAENDENFKTFAEIVESGYSGGSNYNKGGNYQNKSYGGNSGGNTGGYSKPAGQSYGGNGGNGGNGGGKSYASPSPKQMDFLKAFYDGSKGPAAQQKMRNVLAEMGKESLLDEEGKCTLSGDEGSKVLNVMFGKK